MNILTSSTRIFKQNKIISLFIVLNLFLGICIPLGLFSYQKFINQSIKDKGKTLMGADFRVSSRISPKKESLKKIDDFLLNYGKKNKSEILSMFTMGVSEDKMSLMQLRYIYGEYPFYGSLQGDNNVSLAELKSDEALISKEASLKLDLKIGSTLTLDGKSYTVRDIFSKDLNPNIQVGSIAPRIYVNLNEESRRDIKLFGKTIFYSYLYKLANPLLDSDLKKLREHVGDVELRYRTSDNANNRMVRGVRLVIDFSELIFILGLLISMTAFYYVFRHFLSSEKVNINTYKFLGVSKIKILSLYSTYCVLCFAISMGLSFVVQEIVQYFLKQQFVQLTDFSLLENFPVVMMLLLLVFVLLVIIPVLLEYITEKKYYLLNFGALIVLNIIIYIQTNSIMWAPLLIGAILILSLGSYFILPRLYKSYRPKDITRSLALKLMYRKKDLLFSKFFMLFITLFIFNLSPLLLDNIDRYLFSNTQPKPDYFLVDIQEEQLNEMKSYLDSHNISYTEPEPLIRGRLIAINDKTPSVKESADESIESRMKRRSLNRGVNLSYKDALNDSEKLLRGEYHRPLDRDDSTSISLERRYATRLGVDVGDSLTFEIFDLPFRGVVTSIREIKWTSFLPNFFITFPDGVLNNAPKTYISTLKFDKSELSILDFNKKFPNITMIDVSGIITQMNKMFEIISYAIKIMIYSFLFISFVAFCSLIYFHLQIVRKEGDLFNILGMSLSQVRNMRILSYMYLVLPTTIITVFFSYLASYVLVKYFFMTDFYFSVGHLYMNLIIFFALIFYFNNRSILSLENQRI